MSRKKATVVERAIDLAYEATDVELGILIAAFNAIARKRDIGFWGTGRKERKPRTAADRETE